MKILNFNQVSLLSKKLKKLSQKVILTGGCFDILHIGHIAYLENAKKLGKVVLLLESDETIRKLKGKGRPVNTQADRAKVLSSLKFVDYVILLPEMADNDYDQLVLNLKPDIIAITKGDKGIGHKKRQAKLVGGKVVEAVNLIPEYSTSKLLLKPLDN